MTISYSTPRQDAQKILPRFFQYLILSIVVVVIFVPIVILIFGSLKTTGEMYSHPYTIPNPPHWENLLGILSTPSVLAHVTEQCACYGWQPRPVWSSFAVWLLLFLHAWSSAARIGFSTCSPWV